MSARLVVVAGPDKGKVFPLKPGDVLLIGRGRNTGARLTDPAVSRVHCEIKVEPERTLLLDLDSGSGTHVNGDLIDRHELEVEDIIRIGDTGLRFEAAGEADEHAHDPPGKAHPPLLPAQRIHELEGCRLGRYQLGALLAEGQTGPVFKGRDRKTHETVALKLFWPEFARNPRELRRFVRSMKTMLPLRHPHLVQILGAGLTQPYCWTAMEYVEGASLAELTKRSGTVPWQQALRVAVHVCRALVFAHFHHIVHRNISPQNILVRSADREAKLGGLLTAKALEGNLAVQVTRPGELLGEINYLPPERTNGDGTDVDQRSDLYGLGATVYTLLTGQPPLKGKSMIETLLKIRQERPVSTRRYQAAVPEAFDALVMKLLAKAREERPDTAAALLGELERFAKSVGEKT